MFKSLNILKEISVVKKHEGIVDELVKNIPENLMKKIELLFPDILTEDKIKEVVKGILMHEDYTDIKLSFNGLSMTDIFAIKTIYETYVGQDYRTIRFSASRK